MQIQLIIIRTLIALRGKDGIVLAVENIIPSKLHEPRSTHHLHAVEVNIGVVCDVLNELILTDGSCRASRACFQMALWYVDL